MKSQLRRAATAVFAAGALAFAAVGAAHASDAPVADRAALIRVPWKPAPLTPITPAGYTAMFNGVNVCQWGGGDGGEEAYLPATQQHVWFFGDTWYGCGNPATHSSAITQVGGSIHVSRAGAQVLPNDPIVNGRQNIYWIEEAAPCGITAPRCVRLTAAEINIDPTYKTPGWENPYPTTDRVAYVSVSAAGDVTFSHWAANYVAKPKIPTTMYTIDSQPGHYGYDRRCHPDLRLADGGYLVTESQGWSIWQIDPTTGGLNWPAYRNLFYSSRQISGCVV